ncbi:MAG: hypothetical protein ABFS17_09370 [Chloroflexota bacterium]
MKSGKGLKITAIIFMAMTAAMNLLGGAGTVCAAFLTKKFPPMWDLLDYQWLYQPLMILTIITGIAGIWITVKLVRGGEKVYRNALIILVVGSVFGLTQYVASQLIRGASAPANVKFYVNFVTLLIFLALRLPGIKEKVDFTTSSSSKGTTGGLAAFVAGIIILSTFIWAAPSHMYMGDNWLMVLELPLMISGTALTVGGLVAFISGLVSSMKDTGAVPAAVGASGD